jgi:iron complex transport system substrate-binding protein
MGETTITGTPERIVALSHLPIELLYELDIKPVGVSTWEKTPLYGIRWEEYYSGISKKWPNMVNVGSVNEPNFEVIASLKPDLIPYSPFGHVQIYDELSEIAPTIYYSQFLEMENMTQLERLEWQTMGIADALNRHDEGVAMIERMNAKSDEAEGKLEAVGLKGEKFIFSQIFLDENPPLSVFGRDSRQSKCWKVLDWCPHYLGLKRLTIAAAYMLG